MLESRGATYPMVPRIARSAVRATAPVRVLGTVLIAISAALVLHAAPASAQGAAAPDTPGAWLADPHIQSQLAAGKVVSRSVIDGTHARAHIDAAIRIDAPSQTVWKLLTQCRYASIYIPGLRHCRVVNRAPDGSWAVVEHDIKYSAFVPMVRSVFRADYRHLHSIDFHRVAGDFKSEAGEWLLQPTGPDSVTIEYRVSIQPGFWVPRSMVQHSLKRRLPAALTALRVKAERMSATASAQAAASDTKTTGEATASASAAVAPGTTVPAVPADPAIATGSPD